MSFCQSFVHHHDHHHRRRRRRLGPEHGRVHMFLNSVVFPKSVGCEIFGSGLLKLDWVIDLV
jgi:hypothetical protein